MSYILNRVVQECIFKANELRHEYVTVDLLLLVLLQDSEVRNVLKLLDVNSDHLEKSLNHFLQTDHSISRLSSEVMEEIGREQFPNEQELKAAQGAGILFRPELSDDFHHVVERAVVHMQSSEQEELHPIHLVVPIFDLEESQACYLLHHFGVDKVDYLELISHQLPEEEEDVEQQRSTIEQYCININEKVAQGEVSPLIGRQKELKRIFQILARKTKNNPIIVGDAGVGKTALAHGVAQSIVYKKCPEFLEDSVVYALDISSVMAGTKYRGEFEKRLKTIFNVLTKLPHDVILFIDELHTVMGLGATGEGNLDLANILKPILEYGELRCLGSTTYEEYRKFIEKDHAFSRRFQKVDVEEPKEDEVFQILKGLKEGFESFHGVTYSTAVLKKTIELTQRYITDRKFPDKAIDLIDEVGARIKTTSNKHRQKKITTLDLERVVAETANLPQETMVKDDREVLLQLTDKLQKVIFGQDDAISHVVDSIVLSKSPLADHSKPIGSFLFVGPTGVGKTELSKQLAEKLGIEFLRFDMSEYMEKHSVSKLIGAPPGYIGYDNGGILTDAVKKSPHLVLLLDEIEKAHSDIFNVLLQVMDHGVLTDAKGRSTDFRNVILIMTSNAGAKEAGGRSIGLSGSNLEYKRDKKINSFFSPEFRNRLTSVVHFQSLSEGSFLQVVGKNVQLLQGRLQNRGIVLEVSLEAQKWILKQSVSSEFGARNINRYFEKNVALPIAKGLLDDNNLNISYILINVLENQLKFEYKKEESKKL